MRISKTFRSEGLKHACLLLFLSMFLHLGKTLNAQCPTSLACNDNIQISLDDECFAILTPDIMLEDERQGCDYYVTILDLQNNIVASTTVVGSDFYYPAIDGSYIGETWKASVSFINDNGVTIACWGYFTVEDKLPPNVTCIEDVTVACNEDMSNLFTSSSMLDYYNTTPLVDIDVDPNTVTVVVTTNDEANPWEIVESLAVNVSGIGGNLTGSGSAMMMTSGDMYEIMFDAADGSVQKSELIGIQAREDILEPTIKLTLPVPSVTGVHLKVNTLSFYEFQKIAPDNCDPNVDIILTRDELVSLECANGEYTYRRNIGYFTKDNVGLSADACNFSIYFEKNELVDMSWPTDKKYDCNDNIFDDDGNLDLSPDRTGWPTIDGLDIKIEDNLCRINVTYSDDTFDVCGLNTFKILRRWTALDWCAGEYAQSYQSIKVVDEIAPIVTCPPDTITINSNNYNCTADFIVAPLDEDDPTAFQFVSDCSAIDVQVEYQRADEFGTNQPFNTAIPIQPFDPSNPRFRLTGLLPGLNWIRYIVTDECGHTTQCLYEIRVVDHDPPVAVCDQYTAVSIADNGWSRMYAITIDDGSYDECGGPVTFRVRKQVDTLCQVFGIGRDNTEFGDYIEFCCQEAGQSLTAELEVTDESGHTNTCVVSVIVQDKVPFVIEQCPPAQFNLNCGADISPDLRGRPVLSDNCLTIEPEYEDIENLSAQCGTGSVTRRWFAMDNGRKVYLNDCEQLFNFSSNVVLSYNSFRWPSDRADATCSNYTTDLGDVPLLRSTNEPVDEANICGLLSYSFHDKVFYNTEGYCLKIVRTWTVIDWCTYDPNFNPFNGIWSDNQVIKVSNESSLTIDQCPPDTITVDVNNNTCEAFVSIPAPQAYDSCFDRNINVSSMTYTVRDLHSGIVTVDSSGNTASGIYPVGRYRVTWTVTDFCGNEGTCTSFIEVRDTKKPTPYCRGGITTVLMQPQTNGEHMIDIWAWDFDLGSIDNCDANLSFSFDQDDEGATAQRFTCEDLGLNELKIWVTDDFGNQDFCVTYINIQSNDPDCKPTVVEVSGDMPCGNVLDFDGTDDFINVSALSATSDFTFEGWAYYRGSANTYVTLIEYGNDSPFFGIEDGNLSLFGAVTDPADFPVDQWTHFAVTYSGATNMSFLYVNGDSVAMGTTPVNILGQGMGIGYNQGDGYFSGQLDELRIWNTARTQAEIEASMNAQLTGSENGLVLYYDFNDETTPALDRSPAGHHGLLVGVQGDNNLPRVLPTDNDCGGTSNLEVMIAGGITTEYGESVNDVMVELEDMSIAEKRYHMTDETGTYAFEDLKFKNNYHIVPEKDDFPLNGVSTLDLVLIQRHILGLEIFDSPLKMVAADANNNQSVSAVDLVELRKLILGIYEELPSNKSWRFISKSQVFNDVLSPWPLHESIDIMEISDNMMSNDFFGVKIGDVNGSVVLDSYDDSNHVETRSAADMDLSYMINRSDNTVSIHVNEDVALSGFQLVLHVGNTNTIIESVTSGTIGIDDRHYAVKGNRIFISWNAESSVSGLRQNDELFRIVLGNALGNDEVEVTIVGDHLSPEAYDEDLNTGVINIDAGQENNHPGNILFQNEPNPFNNRTTIRFSLATDGYASIRILSVNGQVIREFNGYFDKGMNSIEVPGDNFASNSVYYYKLETEKFSATRKMIFIN